MESEELLEVMINPLDIIKLQHEVMDYPASNSTIEEIYVKEEPVDYAIEGHSLFGEMPAKKDITKRVSQSDESKEEYEGTVLKHEIDSKDIFENDSSIEVPNFSDQASSFALCKTNDPWPMPHFLEHGDEVRHSLIKEGSYVNASDYDTVITECGSRRILERQIPQINEKLRVHLCTACNKSFNHISHLYHHIRSVHEKLRPHKCEECNRAFSRRTHLKNHILSVHEKVKPHKCAECESYFSQKAHLFHHILSVHKKIKTHTCGECNFAFSHKSHLLYHIQAIHEKIKPHKCDECDSAFSRKTYLSHHILSVHRKIKPFKCTLCDSEFSHKSVLCHHVLSIHQNIKPHQCSECEKGYSQKSHLSRHIQSAHKEKTSK